MADWIRTSQDQVHPLYSQLTDVMDTSGNDGLDILPGTTVSFIGRLLGANGPSIGGPAVPVRPGAQPDDPDRGLVRYDFNTNDVTIPGIYYCQWKLTPPGSSQTQTFPEDGQMILLLLPTV